LFQSKREFILERKVVGVNVLPRRAKTINKWRLGSVFLIKRIALGSVNIGQPSDLCAMVLFSCTCWRSKSLDYHNILWSSMKTLHQSLI